MGSFFYIYRMKKEIAISILTFLVSFGLLSAQPTKKLPDLFYAHLAVEPIKSKTDKISELAQIMIDNPTYVIGIDAHFWTGENSESIQNLRSEHIKKKLLEKGIAAERIVFQTHKDNSCGHTPTEAQVKAIKTKADRSAAWSKIRHIRIIVIRKDYVPKQK